MASVEERLSHLEGGYEHLATKADLYQLESRMTKWLVGIVVSIAILAVSVGRVVCAVALGLKFESVLHHLNLLPEVTCD